MNNEIIETVNKIGKLVALYARVSTGRQEKEETIETQLMVMHELAAKNGYKIVKKYIDDGWSGELLARPALDELRQDAKKKIWEGVIFYDPDRIARWQWLQGLVMYELEECNREVIFYTIATPKNEEDKVLFAMRGVFAQYEKMKIAERFRLGKLRKAKEGNIVTGEGPYGYTYIQKSGENKDGYLMVNEQEAEVVKMIFKWVADEKFSMRNVVVHLKELGIPPRKSKRGVWNTSTLGTMIKRRTYIGEGHFLRTYGVVPENPLKKEIYKKIRKSSRKIRPKEEWIIIPTPAIIRKELFDRANQTLKENFALCARNKKNDYLLGGKIYCFCGRRRVGEGPQHGKNLYYRCTDRTHCFPLARKCFEGGIEARSLDKVVWDRIAEFMSSPDLIEKEATKWINKREEVSAVRDTSVSLLKKEMDKLKIEEGRYVKAYGAEAISLEQLKENTGQIKEKIESLRSQILAVEQQNKQPREVVSPTKEGLEQFCQNAQKMLNLLKFETKQKIIREIVEKVTGNQKEVLVEGYLPIEDTYYVDFKTISRNSWVAECWQVNTLSDNYKKTGGYC